MAVPTPHPLTVHREIESTVLRYIDTAFSLRDGSLRAERRRLLSEHQPLLPLPMLEPVVPYDNIVPGIAALEEVGLDRREASWLLRGLFGTDDPDSVVLREHQATALEVAMGDAVAANPVVTSGTGSGKTEAFLLPILARLVREARSWPAEPAANPWWTAMPPRWEQLRAGQRPAAVRALVLYPTNALVEDQVARLRRTVRGISAAGGPSLWFGRYTSAAPGGTSRPSPRGAHDRAGFIASQMRELVDEFDALDSSDPSIVDFMPDPRRAEMFTRWDMIATPPDILITNYSMLNVMLMRQLEEPIFEATRQWLASDPNNVFTLAVDELHLYRGTPGTEVAMIVRGLLMRLGLEPDSSQLRVIGTSASLGDSGHDYLEDFFGVSRERFRIISGRPRAVEATLPVRSADELRMSSALAEACRDETGQIRATPMEVVAERAFGSSSAIDQLERALGAVSREPEGVRIPFRAHYFLRTMRNVWACSNPSCDQIDRSASGSRAEEDGARPAIGRLYGRPVRQCACGGRVLELLYCGRCGDASLGGHVLASDQDGEFLGVDPTDTESERSRYVYERSTDEYRWFLPSEDRALTVGSWKHKGPGEVEYTFTFERARLDPLTGHVQQTREDSNGFVMSWTPRKGAAAPPSLPSHCPRCGHHPTQVSFKSGQVRSAIRAHTQGATQAVQLLVSSVFRTLGENPDARRTIVFSDSVDEAARMSMGLGRNHYQDLVRQLVDKQLSTSDDLLSIARRGVRREDLGTDQAKYDLVRSVRPDLIAALYEERVGAPSEADLAIIDEYERTQTGGVIGWSDLVRGVERDLIALGVAPGGPRASLAQLDEQGTPWYKAFEPPVAGEWLPIVDPHTRKSFADHYLEALTESIADALTGVDGRDGESALVGTSGRTSPRAWTGRSVKRCSPRCASTSQRVASGHPSTPTNRPRGQRTSPTSSSAAMPLVRTWRSSMRRTRRCSRRSQPAASWSSEESVFRSRSFRLRRRSGSATSAGSATCTPPPVSAYGLDAAAPRARRLESRATRTTTRGSPTRSRCGSRSRS
ncbi:DEAD/DEAH box helicase [Amnibacterium sp.]|uniref:DEAD/DEAH box helicase n=1 Tax=Amnibacterium sp. TaxID=1872496 RepID=UPI003F7BCD75